MGGRAGGRGQSREIRKKKKKKKKKKKLLRFKSHI